MRTRPFAEIAAEALNDPVRRARIDERKRAIDDALALAALRADRGISQRQMAGTLGVSQANALRLEHVEDVYLSTLRKYVTAPGGRIDDNANFPNERVTLVAADSEQSILWKKELDK
jgi:transcriptional regulator with XRE-family HTH domain